MATISLALGIVFILMVPFAWTTMGMMRTGVVFAIVCLILAFAAKSDRSHPKLATAAVIINIIAAVLNGMIGGVHMLH